MPSLLQRRRRAAEAPAPERSVAAEIAGEVSGQVAVGEHIVQVSAEHGAIVTVGGGELPVPRQRPTPVLLRPRDIPDLLGRERELEAALRTLDSALPIEFHGPAGVGKTALLRHVAHRPGGALPDGVIYCASREQSTDDMLQFVFDALYECSIPFKPTPGQIRHYLAERKALVLLDDVSLERDDLEALLDAAPQCVFLLGSAERCLWGEGRALPLGGLREDAALALVEAQLGRALSGDERSDLEGLCRALQGHPLQLIKAAARMREEGMSAAELAALAGADAPAEALTAEAAAALPHEHRRVLELLASLDGAPLHVDHVRALTGIDARPILESLRERGLAQAHSPRYSATAPIRALDAEGDSAGWQARLLDYLGRYAEERRAEPERLREHLEPILQTIRSGTEAGRWPSLLRLARAAEGAALISGRWGAWRSMLDSGLRAARALGDRAGEAWALHQLGTRALCLGDASTAVACLREALQLREALGDRAGAAATRHNLGFLEGPPTPPPGPRRPPLAPLCSIGAVAAIFATAGLAGHLGGVGGGNGSGGVDAGRVAAKAERTSSSRATRVASAPTASKPLSTAKDGLVDAGDSGRMPGAPAEPIASDNTGSPHETGTTDPTTDTRPSRPIVDPPERPACGATEDHLRSISRHLERQLGVVQSVTDLQHAGGVATKVIEAEAEALQDALSHVGSSCTVTQTAATLRDLAGNVLAGTPK